MSSKPHPTCWVPLGPIGGISLTLLAAIASAIILLISDGCEVHAWRTFRPTVLLAICTVIADSMVLYIISEGATIAWWRRALSNSSKSATDLHNLWEVGTSILSAARAIAVCRPSFVAIACLASAAVAINGPLLQRASSVVPEPYIRDVVVQSRLSPLAPRGFSGVITGRGSVTQTLQPVFAQVVRDFSSRADIQLNYTGCSSISNSTCDTVLEGAGFSLTCKDGIFDYDLGLVKGTPNYMSFNQTPAFETSVTLPNYMDQNSGFNVSISYKNKRGNFGNGIQRNCSFTASLVRYPVTLKNGTAKLKGTIFDDEVIKKNDLGSGRSYSSSTFGGFVLFASQLYSSAATLRFAGAVGIEINTSGGNLVHTYMQIPDGIINENTTWGDPTPEILAGIREIMFRSAIATANTTDPTQLKGFPGKEKLIRQVYRTEHGFLGLGVMVILCSVGLVLPTFWGYWELNKMPSLSPIETAPFTARIFLEEEVEVVSMETIHHRKGEE